MLDRSPRDDDLRTSGQLLYNIISNANFQRINVIITNRIRQYNRLRSEFRQIGGRLTLGVPGRAAGRRGTG